eukprot:SAG11_NODE_23622_length_385_cov_1.087413_1_plen_21_part_10
MDLDQKPKQDQEDEKEALALY